MIVQNLTNFLFHHRRCRRPLLPRIVISLNLSQVAHNCVFVKIFIPNLLFASSVYSNDPQFSSQILFSVSANF